MGKMKAWLTNFLEKEKVTEKEFYGMDEKKRSKLLRKAEKEFNKLKDGSCPYCGSGNWVKGNIDD